MPILKKESQLKKEINLLGIFAIATGTTLSSGFFLLPGLAAEKAGSAIILAYLIAAIPLIPAMFSIIELSTAMPRAGGVYYFLDRTLGPFFGTIGGIGTWLALILKVAFALIGMGAYIALFFPSLEIIPIAIALALLLGVLNVVGAKESGKFQVFLVLVLLFILAGFIGDGITHIKLSRITNMLDVDHQTLLSTAGLVYISYVGITKVASLSEEVINPEKNLPLGVILSLSTAMLIYLLGTLVMVGVIPIEILAGDLTPVATAADIILGETGVILVSIAAMFAFISVANAGILSSSRYPLAMSRDHLVPSFFRKLVGKGIPLISILTTVLVIVLIILFFDPTKIAKLASAFQLLMFAFVCLAVIVMRESRIDSYDPGYKSPFYPWMQIIGIITAFVLIFEMGALSIIFSFGLVVISTIWYLYYGKKHVTRTGAVYHIFERLGKARYQGLDSELRGILKEKGLRAEDPFDDIVTRSMILDLKESKEFQEVVRMVSGKLSNIIPHTKEEIFNLVMDGTRVGATPVTHGVALPHFRTDKVDRANLFLVRSKDGTKIKLINPISHEEEEEQIVNAIFFLISPEANPAQHLRILAQIAGRVDDESFAAEWGNARNEQELKEALLHNDKFLSINVTSSDRTNYMVGKPIQALKLSKGCLVAMLRRNLETIIPDGSTILKEGDQLTIIGNPENIKKLREELFHKPENLEN